MSTLQITGILVILGLVGCELMNRENPCYVRANEPSQCSPYIN